jgi:methyl-accepting chemotaxis protein
MGIAIVLASLLLFWLVRRTVTGVSEVAAQSAASISQVTSFSNELAWLAGELKDMSARFVV